MSAATLQASPSPVVPGSKKDQVIKLLKAGCRPTDVAAAVGCDISYVSQILDPQTPEGVAIALHRIQALAENADIDAKYDSIEKRLLDGLDLKLDQGVHFLKVETILRAIQTVNSAKRKNTVQEHAGMVINNVINLTVPQAFVKNYQVSPTNEVVAVGRQELISMPAAKILEAVKAKGVSDGEGKPKDSGRATDLERRVEAATVSVERI